MTIGDARDQPQKSGAHTLDANRKVWIKNIAENYAIVRAGLRPRSILEVESAEKIIVLGSGPTLERGLREDPRVREKGRIIVAGVRSLWTAVRCGVVPDYVHIVDKHQALLGFLIDFVKEYPKISTKLKYLIPTHMPSGYLRTLLIQPEQIYMYNAVIHTDSGDPWEHEWNAVGLTLFPDLLWIYQGGHMLGEAALLFGLQSDWDPDSSVREIVYIGGDFCYLDGFERTPEGDGKMPTHPSADLIKVHGQGTTLLTNTQMLRYTWSLRELQNILNKRGIELYMVRPEGVKTLPFPIPEWGWDISDEKKKAQWAEFFGQEIELVNYKATSEFTKWETPKEESTS